MRDASQRTACGPTSPLDDRGAEGPIADISVAYHQVADRPSGFLKSRRSSASVAVGSAAQTCVATLV